MHVVENISDHRLLLDHEAAELLRVAVGTLERWRRTGRGPKFIKLYGKGVRYRRRDLDEWLANHATGGDGGA